jgi:hypothetical protein
MNPVVSQFIERLDHAFHEGDPRATEKAAEKDNVKLLQEQYRALARIFHGGSRQQNKELDYL